MASSDQALPAGQRTIDLRGNGSPPAGAVLADPSGRRAARLRRFGLAVALVFLVWLFGLVLAGLGLLPLSDLPLGRVVQQAARPPELPLTARPSPTSPADLVPARPVAATDGVHATRAAGANIPSTAGTTGGATRQQPAIGYPVRNGRGTTVAPARAPGITLKPGKATAPGQTDKTSTQGTPQTTTPAAPAPKGNAKGQSGTAPGKSDAAPGQAQTSPGQSGTSQGKSDETPSATGTAGNGNAANAPGHDPTRTSGNGNRDGTTTG